jgi:hypothetical protein
MAEKAENVVGLLLAQHDEIRRPASAEAVRGAEAAAPTHPHQGTESPAENLAVGPMAAVADRVRDAIGKIRS